MVRGQGGMVRGGVGGGEDMMRVGGIGRGEGGW